VRSRRQAILLLVPCLLVLVLLFGLPQVLMLVASLGRRSAYGGVVRDLSPANYLRALEPLYLLILAKSFALAFVTTLLCLTVAYPVAFWIGLVAPARWRSALLVLVILPFWTSFLVRMYAWIFILRTEGLLNLGLRHFGVPALPLLYNDFAVLLGQVYGELPFMILPLYASIEKLDRSLLEAAADLGAPPSAPSGGSPFPSPLPASPPGVSWSSSPRSGRISLPTCWGAGRPCTWAT